ncbi:MAG TPA: sugar phosphate isomerase/epimerase [Blastocatellia bacterium]|nr:sugar phosphate isomerase/epimerase [Blastocatellia bacterium]HMZ18890.1 sugar phosphate isomerase/epimerase [Blastocatellia bacterium]HNG29628.1 sugar phosphate isomerase/epimerase [Blastocatellia bacterium]
MISRRDFGMIALAGLPLSVAMAQINPKVRGVRIGVQSYSFRTMSLDEAIKAMADIGIGECELFSGHVEPRPQMGPGGPGGGRPPQGPPGAGGPPGGGQGGRPPMTPEAREEMRKRQEEARAQTRKWRLETPLDYFKGIRKKFDAAGIKLQAYNYSFNDSFTDEEIDRGFHMADALGVKIITASSTIKAAQRVAPFADKYKITVAMHGHSNLTDPNEFAKPESFEKAMAMSKYFAVNLDIGHFFAAGFDPIDYIEKHHARITNLHLKDRKKDNGPNTPWGEGDTPIKPVLQLLKTKKWDIPANIEFEYRGDDAVAEVRKCFQYCKDALA